MRWYGVSWSPSTCPMHILSRPVASEERCRVGAATSYQLGILVYPRPLSKLIWTQAVGTGSCHAPLKGVHVLNVSWL